MNIDEAMRNRIHHVKGDARSYRTAATLFKRYLKSIGRSETEDVGEQHLKLIDRFRDWLFEQPGHLGKPRAPQTIRTIASKIKMAIKGHLVFSVKPKQFPDYLGGGWGAKSENGWAIDQHGNRIWLKTQKEAKAWISEINQPWRIPPRFAEFEI